MRHLRPVLLATLAATTSTLAQYGSSSGAPAVPVLKVATPTRGDVHRFVTQPGTVRPLQQATLYAKVPGYLRTIKVDKGDAVKAGQFLAELDAPELEADLARARGELTKARSDEIGRAHV